MHPTPAEAIGVGGLIAGVLDLTDAIVFYYQRASRRGRGPDTYGALRAQGAGCAYCA